MLCYEMPCSRSVEGCLPKCPDVKEEDQSSMGQRGEALEKMIAHPDRTVDKCVINGNLNQLH